MGDDIVIPGRDYAVRDEFPINLAFRFMRNSFLNGIGRDQADVDLLATGEWPAPSTDQL
ncbi:MAG: hypothetical protein AAFU79_01790 [Myxococcota bacterium]